MGNKSNGYVAEVKGDKLIITVDLKNDLGPSSTGKTAIVAKGAEKLAGGMGLTLCVYRKA